MAWSEALGRPVLYDPATGGYEGDRPNWPFSAQYTIETLRRGRLPTGLRAHGGTLPALYTGAVEAISGVDRDQVEATARMLWEARPVAYYAWSGVEMQTNATQIARAIAQLYALTGSFDAGRQRPLCRRADSERHRARVDAGAQRAKTLGLAERPLGPARWQHVTSDELYRGILEQQPYAVRGLVGFGANLLLSHADGQRGREALAALDFYVHADLFMNPTAELADIVLPVASAFEREALKIGFEISAEAQSLVQLRQRVVEPRGEARSDTEIVFDLACRLGLGAHFWDGDIEAAIATNSVRPVLPSSSCASSQAACGLPLQTRYRKFAEQGTGVPRGFATPTRKIELYSETMLEHGYPPLPEYAEPLVGPFASRTWPSATR